MWYSSEKSILSKHISDSIYQLKCFVLSHRDLNILQLQSLTTRLYSFNSRSVTLSWQANLGIYTIHVFKCVDGIHTHIYYFLIWRNRFRHCFYYILYFPIYSENVVYCLFAFFHFFHTIVDLYDHHDMDTSQRFLSQLRWRFTQYTYSTRIRLCYEHVKCVSITCMAVFV